MINAPTTNRKVLRQLIDSSGMDEITNIKRSKSDSYFSPINSMKFIEVLPLNSSNKPHPRSGHRAIATESDLWIWGGYFATNGNRQQRLFDELWRFNYPLQQWTHEKTTGTGPTSTLASHSMCLYRNLLFVFGGTGFPFGQHVSNELFILDLKQRHWQKCQLLNEQPEPVYGASMLVNNDHLYILCGTNGRNYNSDVYDVHIPTLNCTKIGSTFNEVEDFGEGGRYRQEAYIHENKIYLFGGGGSTGVSFSLENLPVFDIIAKTWSFIHTNPDPIHNYPSARKFHSVLPFRKNQIIVFGGAYYDQDTNRHVVVSEHLWKFDFDKLEWSLLPSLTMVKPSYFQATAINESGEIWAHGGVIHESTSLNNETRITTLYKMHSRVSKLSELAWNHFLNSLSDRSCLIKQPQLISELYIPTKFMKRIH